MAHIPDIDHETPIPRVSSLPRFTAALQAGYWLVDKARLQARVLGTQQAARNLRKQGVPLEIALSILGTRS